MSQKNAGLFLAVLGIACVLVTFVKFTVIGYYPDEFMPYLLLGILGAGIAFAGDRLYRNGLQR